MHVCAPVLFPQLPAYICVVSICKNVPSLAQINVRMDESTHECGSQVHQACTYTYMHTYDHVYSQAKLCIYVRINDCTFYLDLFFFLLFFVPYQCRKWHVQVVVVKIKIRQIERYKVCFASIQICLYFFLVIINFQIDRYGVVK